MNDYSDEWRNSISEAGIYKLISYLLQKLMYGSCRVQAFIYFIFWLILLNW